MSPLSRFCAILLTILPLFVSVQVRAYKSSTALDLNENLNERHVPDIALRVGRKDLAVVRDQKSSIQLEITAEGRYSQRTLDTKSLLIAKGGVGDGGGSGVACFDRWEQGITDISLDSEGRLRPEFRNRIKQVWLTDLLEIIQGPHGGAIVYRDFLPGETVEAYVQDIVEEKVRPLSARFADLMKRALKEVSFRKWIPIKGIPAVDDVGRSPNVLALKSSNQNICTFVQIARRKIVVNADNSIQVVVEYDPDLYGKLESSDTNGSQWGRKQKALLQIHEAVYFIAAQLGHENSVASRALSRILMSESLSVNLQDPINTNFDFLYMLNSAGFLSESFFSIPPEEATGEFYRSGLTEILDRVKKRNQKKASCNWLNSSAVESQFPCELYYIGQRFHHARDFIFLFTSSELEQSDSRLALFLYGLARHAEHKAPLMGGMHSPQPEANPTRFAEDMIMGDSQLRSQHIQDLCHSLESDREAVTSAETYFKSLRDSMAVDQNHFFATNEFKKMLDIGAEACKNLKKTR